MTTYTGLPTGQATYPTMHGRQDADRDDEVAAEDGGFASKRDIEKEEDERAVHESLVSYDVLGIVSGTTTGRGYCQGDTLVRHNAVRDDEVVAEDGFFSSKQSIEKEEDDRAVHESLVSYVVLGKVSGTTAGRGNCKQDRDRIIIGGKLLVVKWEQHNLSYAPATKDTLEISYEECAYLSVGTKKRRHVFMRRGELVGGERGGSYYLDTIRC